MEPVVICSVLEADAAATTARVADAPAACALVEVRADRLRADEVESVVRTAGRPVIVTVRTGSAHERRAILTRALTAGAAFVDVEWDGPLADLANGAFADRVILSHHGAACERPALEALLRAMRSTRAARIKLVPRAGSIADAQVVRDLLAHAAGPGAPVACFALGAPGVATRILGPSWGSWATYGSAARGRETGEGQVLASELLEVYDVLGLGPGTRRFALVGSPVGASPSPALHRAGYREAGLDAVFLPLDTASIDDLVAAVAAGSALSVEAFGVTIPLKENVARRAVPSDPASAASGAVNTVLVRDGAWQAHNTDGPAIVACVRRTLDPRAARVAVAGAGGTARAAGWALRAAGASVTLFNRDLARAQRVAEALGVAAAAWETLAVAEWDVLIQATPLGRAGEELPLPGRLPGRLVLDAVYADRATPLVERARACGLAVVDGYELLVAQAQLQFGIMTGRTPSRAAFEAALREHLARGSGSARGSRPS